MDIQRSSDEEMDSTSVFLEEDDMQRREAHLYLGSVQRYILNLILEKVCEEAVRLGKSTIDPKLILGAMMRDESLKELIPEKIFDYIQIGDNSGE